MRNEIPKFEQNQPLEVEGSKQVIEALDSISKPIEEIKMMVIKMQEMQAGASDKLSGQFSEQNIQWINSFAKKVQEASAENVKQLRFLVGGNFNSMEEDYDKK